MEITAGGPISAFVEAAARNARVCTRLATRCHEDPMMARKTGDTASCRHGEPCSTLSRARTEPLAIYCGKKGSFLLPCKVDEKRKQAPPPKRRG